MRMFRTLVVAACLTVAGTAALAEPLASCPGVSTPGTLTLKLEWKNKDLSKVQCRRVVKTISAEVDAWLRKNPTGNVGALWTECIGYCTDLYPTLRNR
jgi:hypothetical protein